MQELLVFAAIVAAVAYAFLRLLDVWRNAGNPCRGCKLGEACSKRNLSRKRKNAERLRRSEEPCHKEP